MFLFDKQRSARQKYVSGNSVDSIKWKTFLNTNPLYGAESTAVFDKDENIYFGSHSGNFYSLDIHGNIRWVFTTKKKIYSSPLLINGKVIFTGGDGYVYCLNVEGELLWKYDMAANYKSKSKIQKLNLVVAHLPFTYSVSRKKNITYRSWSSPNFDNDKMFVTGFDEGLVCLNPNGNRIWSYDLGFPRFQLSGVAISNKTIFGSSRNGSAYCISEEGNLIWDKIIKRFWEPWGNPVICTINKFVFFFFSWKESTGLVVATNFHGEIKWKCSVGAIRGSCAVTKSGEFIYFCDLDGYIYKAVAVTGKIIQKKQITKCKRGLWITPTLDKNGDILLSTKDANHKGRVIKLDPKLNIIWEYHTGKVLSVPVVNKSGDVFFGSWDGNYYSLKTK